MTASIKQANLPIAAQLAGAILGVSLLESDREHVAEREAEAEMMNHAFRVLEARKMSQTINALKTAEAVIGEVVKTAAAAASGMDKLALGGIIGGLSRLGKSLGGAAPAAARLQSPRLLSTGTKAKLMVGAGALGAGYAGLKTLQAGRDYLNQPHHPGWGKGPKIMHDVNEFGHPQY